MVNSLINWRQWPGVYLQGIFLYLLLLCVCVCVGELVVLTKRATAVPNSALIKLMFESLGIKGWSAETFFLIEGECYEPRFCSKQLCNCTPVHMYSSISSVRYYHGCKWTVATGQHLPCLSSKQLVPLLSLMLRILPKCCPPETLIFPLIIAELHCKLFCLPLVHSVSW